MPMTQRQLAQATLDYKPFLPAGARITEVQRRWAGHYEATCCDLCDLPFRYDAHGFEGEEIKLLTVSLTPGNLFKRFRMYVCRNGVACRGRVAVPGAEKRQEPADIRAWREKAAA